MDSISEIIDLMINRESEKGSNSVTRGTVKLRVFLKIARIMGISLQSIYDTKDLIQIDPQISKAIEILWNGHSVIDEPDLTATSLMRSNDDKSSEDSILLERLFSKDFARPVDLAKSIAALRKRYGSSDSFDRQLWYVFAVDGLLSSDDRFERYSDNLALPIRVGEGFEEEDPAETHVRAVRTLYRDVNYATPDRMGATLLRLLKINTDNERKKKRGDSQTTASSESSDIGSDLDEENKYDKYIADQYKRLVGLKLIPVTNWIRERLRVRKLEEEENARRRALATRRKNTSDNADKIRNMPKKNQKELSETKTESKEEKMDSASDTVSHSAEKTDSVKTIGALSPEKSPETNVEKPKKRKKKKELKNEKSEESGKRKKLETKPKKSKKVEKPSLDNDDGKTEPPAEEKKVHFETENDKEKNE